MICIVLISIVFCNLQGVLAQNAPYPPSSALSGVTWDPSTLVVKGIGSDNWATTWGPDDKIYTTWGDGGGFGGGDAGMGVASIAGPPENFTGTNLWSVSRG